MVKQRNFLRNVRQKRGKECKVPQVNAGRHFLYYQKAGGVVLLW